MMLPSDFELHRPTTVEEAAGLRAELGDAAALYAGGTELLLAMKLGVLDYEHLIDVKRIDALRGIERREGELRIGALVTHAEHGPGWVWGSGVGRVTVRFETAETGPGPVRTFRMDDPDLAPRTPVVSDA